MRAVAAASEDIEEIGAVPPIRFITVRALPWTTKMDELFAFNVGTEKVKIDGLAEEVQSRSERAENPEKVLPELPSESWSWRSIIVLHEKGSTIRKEKAEKGFSVKPFILLFQTIDVFLRPRFL